jgi:hypothetical protein
MTRHLPGTWADAGPALLAAVERRRANREAIACIVAELVLDRADGTAWVVVEHGMATAAPVPPGVVLREFAAALIEAAAELETVVQ